MNFLLSIYYFSIFGNYNESLNYAEISVKNLEELFPNGKHPDLAASYSNLGAIYQGKGLLDDALNLLNKSVKINEELYPDGKHPDLAASYSNLGAIYQGKGLLDDALPFFSNQGNFLKNIFLIVNILNII
jgi:tetratricopeptide (TPR) repeat protein